MASIATPPAPVIQITIRAISDLAAMRSHPVVVVVNRFLQGHLEGRSLQRDHHRHHHHQHQKDWPLLHCFDLFVFSKACPFFFLFDRSPFFLSFLVDQKIETNLQSNLPIHFYTPIRSIFFFSIFLNRLNGFRH